MTAARSRGPIVIDTDVFGADLVPGSRLAELYAPIITGRPALISFQTDQLQLPGEPVRAHPLKPPFLAEVGAVGAHRV